MEMLQSNHHEASINNLDSFHTFFCTKLPTCMLDVQGPAKEWFPGCENFSGKARQNSETRAGRNFTQPRTEIKSHLCTSW